MQVSGSKQLLQVAGRVSAKLVWVMPFDVPHTEREDRWTRDQDGTGFSVWYASTVLAEYLVKNADTLPQGGSCVELGSGLGLCGMALAKCGRESVVFKCTTLTRPVSTYASLGTTLGETICPLLS